MGNESTEREMRKLIINADDYGLSDGICRAINDLFGAGAVSSTTLMVAANRGAERCRAWGAANLAGKAGVHLQLTGGHPILSASEVPTLVDPLTGLFRGRDSLTDLDPSDVEREWHAQVQLASDILGAKPSHLDSHHGAHHIQGLAEIFVKLALELNLPVRDRSAMREFCPQANLAGSDLVLYEWTAGGRVSVVLENEVHAAAVQAAAGDVLEVVTHPGYSDDYLRSVSSLNDLRETEVRALMDLARRDWFHSEGLHLVSFSDLAGCSNA